MQGTLTGDKFMSVESQLKPEIESQEVSKFVLRDFLIFLLKISHQS